MRETLSTLPSTTPIGPTPERMAKAPILKPLVDGRTCRPFYQVVDVVTRHAPQLGQETIDAVRQYADGRLSVETGTLALNTYEAKVDYGGWRSEFGPGADTEESTAESTSHEDAVEIARIHRHMSPQLRRAADAFIDAVANPRRPCPFETLVGEKGVITTLESIADCISVAQKQQ